MKSPLFIALGSIIVIAGAVFAWTRGGDDEIPPPEVLAKQALTLPDAGDRELAVVRLSASGESVSPQLRQIYQQSESPNVRAAALSGLAKQEDYVDMETLLAALEDESPRVRGRAGAALQRMLGLDFYFRAMDPPEKRQAAINRIRAAWGRMQSTGRLEEWKIRRETLNR